MMKIRFPIVHNNENIFPQKPTCPWCNKEKVFEPHSFSYILGGALLMDRQKDEGGSSSDMDAFLTIGWHGAHKKEYEVDNSPEIDIQFDIANEVIGGQFGIYFCSTQCLRLFFNNCIDELESRISKQ